jgi:CHAT domain-containing protein
VRRGPSDRAAADAERGLRDARIRAEAFRTSVYTAHPELRGQRSEAPAVGAPELAALVTDENAALVEFAVTPEATFVFVVTAGEPVATTVHRLALSPDALQRLAADYVSALEGRDLGFRTAGRAVSRALLAPIESRLRGLTRLIVVPDGPVWDLPFQALMLADGRFVVERFAVTYATSLTALREQRARAVRQDVRPRSVAAFGDPQIPRGTAAGRNAIRADELAPLPAAAREVRALGRLYGTASRVWVGPDATEGRFKGEAGAYSIVHVATHGILNNDDPMSSHLLLAPSGEGPSAEDGRLQARELLGLGLDADLVVLSGCETAKGRTGRGEGVIGLTWALFIAGVPTTVVSQWQVESESTERLMSGLHQRLAATGATAPAEALRASAVSMLTSDQYRHPFYWAGFLVVGDGLRPLR